MKLTHEGKVALLTTRGSTERNQIAYAFSGGVQHSAVGQGIL